MSHPGRRLLLRAFMINDMLCSLIGFAAAIGPSLIGSGDSEIGAMMRFRVSIADVVLGMILVCCWQMIFSLLGLYHSRRLYRLPRELAEVSLATTLCAGATWVWGNLGRVSIVTPRVVLAFLLITGGMLILSRILLRFTLRRVRARGRNVRHLIIVGTNERAVRVGNFVTARPEIGYRLAGFIDDPWPGGPDPGSIPARVVASLAECQEYLRHHVVDEVVMCLPMKSQYHEGSEIVSLCARQGITVRFHGDLFHLTHNRDLADPVAEAAFVTVYTGELEGTHYHIKRLLDFMLAAFLLLLTAPVMVLIALAIRLTSTGPILFTQDRMGLNKRIFRIMKFRSMYSGAEQRIAELEAFNEVSGPVFKMKNDPRCTPVGRLLRKTSLDELPQLFNVLMGDMSLVGPRPLPLRDIAGISEDQHRCRFSVRPGITCIWQVSGRSIVPFETWMELDKYYVDNWNLWLDLKILLKTVPAVLRGSGAA